MRTMVLEVTIPRVVVTQLLARFWRGAYFAPFAPLRMVEMRNPSLPAPEWVRVRNLICGICGSDLHQLFVDAGLDVAPVALPSHHRVYLGHEMVGEVVEIGQAVSEFCIGDRVVRWGRGEDCLARGRDDLCPPCARGHRVLCQFASEWKENEPVGGGFSDSFITPASTLVRVPDSVSDEEAIFTEPAAVALHAVLRRPPQAGDRVLVLGCGTIGYLLLQVLSAVQPQCDLTAVAQFAWQAELALAYGAKHVFLSSDDGDAEVARLTGAKLYEGRAGNRMLLGGFDSIFDVVGNEQTLNQALRWARAQGAVVLVGVNLHRMRLDVTPVWYQEVDLLGAVGHDIVTWQGESVSAFELAMRWMQSGLLRCGGLLTHRFSLNQYRQAFAAAADKRTHRSVKVAFKLAEHGGAKVA